MESKQQEAECHDIPPPPYEDHMPMQQKQPLMNPPGGQQAPLQGGYPYIAQSGYPQSGGYPAPGAYPNQQYMNQPLSPNAPVYNPVVMVQPVMANPPPNHLALAIFATLCCCWPIGIFAILQASSCKSAISIGDRQTAERLSRKAKKFSMWAIGIGVVFNVLSIAIVVAIYALYIIPEWDFD